MELVEERGETGRWESRWSGRRWPWKKISSAGDKSTANDAGEDLVVLPAGRGFVDDGLRDMVKENSWDGEDAAEGGDDDATLPVVVVAADDDGGGGGEDSGGCDGGSSCSILLSSRLSLIFSYCSMSMTQ